MTSKEFFSEGANWRSIISEYQKSSAGKSAWQLINTFIPYMVFWYLMYLSLGWSYWITLLLSVPAAGFTVRLFIIQHDCGHGSFFSSRKANDRTGIFCSLFTLTPYHYWKQNHNIHHANAGNLEHRGIGDIYTMTVQEYLSKTKWQRFKYRLYRNPLVLFIIIPTALFVILNRFPTTRAKVLKPTYPSIYYTNFLVAAIFVGMGLWVGFLNVIAIQLPITIVASTSGLWLFYVQHQYEDTYWSHDSDWDFSLAALQGSSYYKLPKVLQWFTGNIGFHHIHHLSPKIPNYNLEKCHKTSPVFQKAITLTIKSSLKSTFLTLWDENQKKLVSFRYLKKMRLGVE